MPDIVSVYNYMNTDKCHNSLLMYRRMIQEAKRRKEPVGFLDPHLISKQCINDNVSYVEDYITTGLYARNDEYILVLYNQVWHWILIVIVPKWNKVIYLDSLIKSQQDFTLVQQLINRRFAAYIAKGGRHVEGNTTL